MLEDCCAVKPSGSTPSWDASIAPMPYDVKVDDTLQVQLSALRDIVKDLKSEIVKELERVMQRELSSNLQEVKAAVRAMQHVNMADIDLDFPSPVPGSPKSLRGSEWNNSSDTISSNMRSSTKQRVHKMDASFARGAVLDERKMYSNEASGIDASLEETSDLESTSHLFDASSIYGQDEILKVVTRKHTNTLNLYLHKKLDPNLVLHDIKLPSNSKQFTHCSLLALAVLAGRTSHVSLLVNMKASIDNSTYGFFAGALQLPWSGPALTATVPRNDQATLQLLLNKKADITAEASNGANFIWQCAYFGKHELLKQCLRSADVSEYSLGRPAEYQNQNGISYSPLHISVVMGQESCSRLLLEAKAPVDVANEELETPLGTALQFCRPELVTMLIKEGALRSIVERRSIPGIQTPRASDHSNSSEGSPMHERVSFQDRFSQREKISRNVTIIAQKLFKRSEAFPSVDDIRDTSLKEGIAQLFAKMERNPVLVHAVAEGLQSQPEQVEMLSPRAILEFWRMDTTCMAAMLDAMFAERLLRFRGESAAKEIRECKTAIVVKSERLKNNSLYRHPIVVSSIYSHKDILALEKSQESPDEDMLKFTKELAPQHMRDAYTSWSSMMCEYRHVPIGVYECLVPGIHHDLRFLKIIANVDPLDAIFLNPHCQAIITHSWNRCRRLAVVNGCVHFMLLAFFVYVAVNRNDIGVNGLRPGMSDYEEISSKVQWAAVIILPFWLFELASECIEFAAHVTYGWAMEYLTDFRNLLDEVRILMDGAIIFSIIIGGFDATEDIIFRSFLGAVCALKWTKMLYCLTPFRNIGLQVIPILFTLNTILPCVAITGVYFSGLAHGFVALDVLPHGFAFTLVRSVMFAASGETDPVEELNNPDNQEDFQSWWLQLILVLAMFFLPITFMNIFIAAMSLSFELGVNFSEQLYHKRCVDASFSHACVKYAFKKGWGREAEREKRLWYCRDRSDD